MALEDLPSLDELAEATGQTREQLRKDRDAAAGMADGESSE
jgi:hypothetical protein